MPKILITGSNSFVGTNFRKFSKFTDIEEISLRLHKPEDIEFGKYDIVLHLAAIVHQSKKIPESEYMKVNRDLCLRVAQKAKKSGVTHFIFLSTCKVYGDSYSGSVIRNEDSECIPDDPYGKSKYEAETGLRKLEDDNFAVSIIRTPLVYGEGVKANMMSIVKLVDFFPVLPFKKIRNRRSFTYTENMAGFIDRIIEKKAPGIFIAMDDNPLSTTELIEKISRSLEKKIWLFKIPDIMIKTGIFLLPGVFDRLFNSFEFENSKTKMMLDYSPPFTSDEGIRRMVSTYMTRKKLEDLK